MKLSRLPVRSACVAFVLLGACDENKESNSDSEGAAGAPAVSNMASSAVTDSTSGHAPTQVPAASTSVGAPPSNTTAASTSEEPTESTATEEPATEPLETAEVEPTDAPTESINSETGVGGAGEPTSGTGGTGGNEYPMDACAGTVLCDDFEAHVVGMEPVAPWTSEVNGGGIEVSNERAFSGSNSVHVSNTSGAYKRAYFSVTGEPLFPAAGAEMYGRMMMWLEATPVGSVHWTFIQGEGPSEDGSYDIFYRYGGQHDGKLMANFETQGKATDCWDHSETVMPTMRWACLEWRFNVGTDEMQFWLDGTEIADIHATGMGEGCVNQDLAGAWPAPLQFEVLRLGWEKYQESAQLDAWIDDVAVSTTARVGCPAQ